MTAKPSVPAPLPRIKSEKLQQQTALIPAALPEQATAKDGHESCLQKLRAMGAEFTPSRPQLITESAEIL